MKRERWLHGRNLQLAAAIISGMLLMLCASCNVRAASPAGAATISTQDIWVSGTINSNQRTVFYRVTIPKAGYLTVTYQGQSLSDAYYTLYNESQSKTYFERFVSGASDSNPKTGSTMRVLEAGTYYIKVRGSGSTGSYRLKTLFEEAGNNEKEPNDNYSEAENLSSGQTVTGLISEDDPTDYYKIRTSGPGYLTVTYQGQSLSNSYVALYNADQTKTYYNDFVSGASSSNPKTKSEVKAMDAGTYYIKVVGSGSTGRYRLSASFSAVSSDDREPNNDYSKAQTLSFGRETKGFITEDDSADYYKITVPKAQKVTVTCTGRSLKYLYFTLYNTDQTKTYFNQFLSGASEANPKTSVKEQELDAGIYYIKINGSGSTGTYTIKADLQESTNQKSDSDSSKADDSKNTDSGSDSSRDSGKNIDENTDSGKDGSQNNSENDSQSNTTKSFSDVSTSAWYYHAVIWAVEEGITEGTGNGKFSPNRVCTRAQMAVFLYNEAGRPSVSGTMPFHDVTRGSWYYNAVLWVYQKGITSGVTRGRFAPNDNCTRAQMAVFLYNAAKKPSVSGSMPFNDVKRNSWYYRAVLWAYQNKITTGTSGNKFSPSGLCTRAQMVQFLYNG